VATAPLSRYDNITAGLQAQHQQQQQPGRLVDVNGIDMCVCKDKLDTFLRLRLRLNLCKPCTRCGRCRNNILWGPDAGLQL
jgi:hypothetical protein